MSVLDKFRRSGMDLQPTGFGNKAVMYSWLAGKVYFSQEEIAALAEELLEMTGLGWQPIESAPKDGTKVDLWLVDHFGNEWRQPDAWYVQNEFYGVRDDINLFRDGWFAENMDYDSPWFCDSPEYQRTKDVIEFVKATHWRPLPQAPKVK